MTNYLKRKWWTIAIIMLLIMNIVTFGFFWFKKLQYPIAPPLPPEKMRRGAPPPFLIEELGLSVEQQKQYGKLFWEHQQQVRRVKDSIRMAKESFFSLLSSTSTSAEELQKKAAASARLDERLDMLTFEHFIKVKHICTPQQLQKFDKVIRIVIERMAPPPPPPPPAMGGLNGDRPPPSPGIEAGNDNRPLPPGGDSE